MQNENHSSDSPASAFPRIWFESFSKLAQAALTFSPDSVPPEMLRQVRTGVFQALSQSWDEFLRSPEFLEGMKQIMDQGIAFRQLSTELFTKARHDIAGVAQEDVDGAVVVLQRIERRVLDRLEGVSRQVADLNRRLDKLEAAVQPGKAKPARPPARGRKLPRQISARKPKP